MENKENNALYSVINLGNLNSFEGKHFVKDELGLSRHRFHRSDFRIIYLCYHSGYVLFKVVSVGLDVYNTL